MNQVFMNWRRFLIPVAIMALTLVAGAIGIYKSNTSSIIVYNQTGRELSVLKVVGCAQTAVFYRLADEDLVRLKLVPEGQPSEIDIEATGQKPIRWKGGYIEPKGGYRVTLRLWPDGTVELHTQISFWHRMIHEKDPGWKRPEPSE